MKTFNTCEAVYAERGDYWREAISQTFVPLESTFSGGAREGVIHSGVWGEMKLTDVSCSAQEVIRLRNGADHLPENVLLLSVVSHGKTSVSQAGKCARLGQGEFGLYDTRYPYQLHIHGETRQHVVQIRSDQLTPRLGRTEPLVANAFGKAHPLTGFLQMQLQSLMALPEDIPAGHAALLQEQFLDLLSRIILDECGAGKPSAGSCHGLLFRIKILINQRLTDPLLSPASVAEAFGISTRYLNMLLKKEGTSFCRYLLEQRLNNVAEALQSPLHRSSPVSQIAWNHGFSDMPYFSRAFKARFGESPTGYRNDVAASRCTVPEVS